MAASRIRKQESAFMLDATVALGPDMNIFQSSGNNKSLVVVVNKRGIGGDKDQKVIKTFENAIREVWHPYPYLCFGILLAAHLQVLVTARSVLYRQARIGQPQAHEVRLHHRGHTASSYKGKYFSSSIGSVANNLIHSLCLYAYLSCI
jgi:GTP-binding protein